MYFTLIRHERPTQNCAQLFMEGNRFIVFASPLFNRYLKSITCMYLYPLELFPEPSFTTITAACLMGYVPNRGGAEPEFRYSEKHKLRFFFLFFF